MEAVTERTDTSTGNVVGECFTENGLTYNVKATIGAGSVTALQYEFTPVPAQQTAYDAPGGKTRYFLVTPGTYTVVAGNPQPQGKYTITAPNCNPRVVPATKGMTWRFINQDPVIGTISVGCVNCNAYQGDTPCTTCSSSGRITTRRW